MIGIRELLEYLSVRKLRLRASQIAELARNPHVTVYPREIDFSVSGKAAPQRVAVLAPHADDETFGAGGALLRHVERGDQVEVVLFSDNVASVDGATVSEAEKCAMREAEFISAMDTLGIEKRTMLRIGNRSFADSVYPDYAFRALIEIQPDVLYLPSLFDNHHDHRMLNVWLLRTLRAYAAFRPLVRGYEVWTPLPATAVADITGYMEGKRAAMSCYASQITSIDYMHHIEGLNAYRAMTLGGRRARHAEAFLELPADVYLELGNSLYLS